MSSNITVIIPIHEVQDNLETYLHKALNSVVEQTTLPSEVLIVIADDKKLNDLLNNFDFRSN